MISIATVFSGIGAIEQAVCKVKLEHEIVFACDNGERKLDKSFEELKKEVMRIKSDMRKDYIEHAYNDLGKINHVEISYKKNYKIDDADYYQDIRFLDAKKYKGKVDLLVGGSPCQSFSVNGKRAGLKDTRGTLFYDYARIIKEVSPTVFIFENVKGMITHDFGKSWEVIKQVFHSLNYDIYIKKDEKGKEDAILNSRDYGIPQDRRRLFIVGFKKGLKNIKTFQFPEKIELRKSVSDFLDENVDAKYYLGEKGFKFVTTHPSRAQVSKAVMRCQKANQQFNWNGDFIFEKYNKIRLRKEVLSRAYVSYWNGEKGVIRKMTPRECLRLMGFSDEFKIVVNDAEMYRQAGNSIVVDVLEYLLKSIIETNVWEDKI